MRLLADLIREFPDDTTSQAIATALNALTVTRTNTQSQGLSSVESAIGHSDTEVALAVIAEIAKSDPYIAGQLQAFYTNGWNFADPRVQEFIDQLVAGNAISSTLGDKLKAIGIWKISRAADAGWPELTADRIDQERAEMRRLALHQFAADQLPRVYQMIDAGTITTESAVLAALGGN